MFLFFQVLMQALFLPEAFLVAHLHICVKKGQMPYLYAFIMSYIHFITAFIKLWCEFLFVATTDGSSSFLRSHRTEN